MPEVSPSNGVSAVDLRAASPVTAVTYSADRLLIIDDSNQIRSNLVTHIIRACILNNRPYRLIHCDPGGFIETTAQESGQPGNRPLIIYTANCPRNALPVLNLPELQRLIIVSDIMMPGDTRVGLIGLLHELSRRRLPVSLIFASSEKQNRYYVEEVIQSGKALFMEKGGSSWGQLPFLLVEKSAQFQYKIMSQNDFDKGATRNVAAIEPVAPPEFGKPEWQSVGGALSSGWQSPAAAVIPASQPKPGFWSRLAFWKR